MNTPRQDDNKTIGPQNASGKESPKMSDRARAPPKINPPPECQDKSCSCRYEPTPWYVRALEVIALLSGISYAIVTYCMWRDSNRNFGIDERAWVQHSAFFPNMGAEKIPLESDIQFQNTGKTAVKIYLSQFIVKILKDTEAVDFNYQNVHETVEQTGIIAPGAIIKLPVIEMVDAVQQRLLTKTEADELLGGTAYLAIYGQGVYRDIFGNVYWFHFCSHKTYHTGGIYNYRGCTAYNDIGDGELPQK